LVAESFKVAPYNAVAWIWTIIYLLATIYFAGLAISDLISGYIPDPIVALFAVFLVPLMIYAWLRSVRGYRLEGNDLIVDRAGPGKIHIAVSNIDSVNGSPDLGSFFNRSFLSLGGVFGWSGRVGVRKAQDINTLDADAYGTNSSKMVLLEMKDGRKIILTPQDPQAMETSLRSAGVGPRPVRPTSSKPRVAKSAKRK
jgi:hypothetical protein